MPSKCKVSQINASHRQESNQINCVKEDFCRVVCATWPGSRQRPAYQTRLAHFIYFTVFSTKQKFVQNYGESLVTNAFGNLTAFARLVLYFCA